MKMLHSNLRDNPPVPKTPVVFRRGATVVILCRNTEKAEAAAEEIRKETKGDVVVHK